MKFKSIVILTGAGISAESGIKTFRASDGLWENHRIEDVATPDAFIANPKLVHDFYNQRRQQLMSNDIQPNKAHLALAALEKQFAGEYLLVTQNIDNLHEAAGSQNLIHMHGELLKMHCVKTQQIYDIKTDLNVEQLCPCCQRANRLRPHIVWFGEMPLQMERIYHALANCDLFISVGTSGNVYPAAGFVAEAKKAGAHTVEINLEPSSVESVFVEKHYGKAGDLLPNYIKTLLE